MRRIVIVTGGLLIGALLGSGESLAQRRPLQPDTGEAAQSAEANEARGLFATGLTPVFPEAAECPGISSPHGSPTRYDGSPRRNDHGGVHNGLDITLAMGTPLLSAADGEVIHAGTAGRLVGNFIWLRYAPDATGLPVYAFVRYQHLDQPTPLKVGDRVAKGQQVGLSGYTGTTGGYYGHQGYAHLHFNVRIAQGPDFGVNGAMVIPTHYAFLDPLGLYLGAAAAPFDNHVLRALPAEKKRVAVPVTTGDGRIIPEGARTIWPVACRSR
jgi:murein DD-endopeptidase MepM/ murein hydrolase activator NlpD